MFSSDKNCIASHQKCITTLYVYTFNKIALHCMKQKLVELPGKTDRFIISVGNFNIQYSYYLIEHVEN